MANIDRFMIAPITSGLQTNTKPFMIPDDAFQTLENMYVFRGRLRKRFGSKYINSDVLPQVQQLYSRLRIKVGTTAAVTGNFPATVMPGTVWKEGQLFSIGSTIYTANTAGGATLCTSIVPVGTYDTLTGTFSVVGNGENPSTDVYFYPSEPVMGLISYESPLINDEPVYAFDTQFAYQYTLGGWDRLGGATGIWTGNDSQFFWGVNYRGLLDQDYTLYIVNYNAADGIKYYNSVTNVWTTITPILSNTAGNTLKSARCVAVFKKRLLFFNTIEHDFTPGGTDNTFVNRVRYSSIGSPLGVNSFNAFIPGNGNFIDAPTKEQIISIGFIKDRLIVYFERSAYELVYTGSDTGSPFVFQKINDELGVEATNSTIQFDRVLLGLGNVGVHACNGASVTRIDQKIPDEIFQTANQNQAFERTCGIRDYFTEMVYWSFASHENFVTYPNRVLVYNYVTGSWAINDDSITAFGYFQPQRALTWAECLHSWASTGSTWTGGSLNALYRTIIAGNQEGYVFLIDPDCYTNAAVLQITDIVPALGSLLLDVYEHNLVPGDYIKITGITAGWAPDVVVNNKIYEVQGVINRNTISIQDPGLIADYTGGGVIARVSNINVLTKQYNFYMDQGRNAFISKVDFYVDKTSDGEVTVDSYIGSSWDSQITSGRATGALLGSSILETRPYYVSPNPLAGPEQYQERIWHPLYFAADGECIQLRFYLSPAQMLSVPISESDFEINAMTFYATPTASRLQ